MNIFRNVTQNILLGLPPVQRVIKRFHKTGLNNRDDRVDELFENYRQQVEMDGKKILELGPGQTFGLMQRALANGAASCSAVDLIDYQCSDSRIDFRLYDGKMIPFADETFDVIWSADVFEHLRYPKTTLLESFRVLKSGGVMLCKVDLRDHYKLNDESEWLACLKYSTMRWNAMTWNRSAYVNRWRLSTWKKEFEDSGFRMRTIETQTSDVLRARYAESKILHKYSLEDTVVYRFDALLEKP